MDYYREPETGTLVTGYVLLGLSIPALVIAGSSMLLSLFGQWSVFGYLADEHRVPAAFLFALIASAAVMALVLGVRSISDKRVEGKRPIPTTTAHPNAPRANVRGAW